MKLRIYLTGILLLLICSISFAEGTKQLRPTASTFGQLNPFDKGGNFASYTSPEERRLHIRIGDHVEENIYFGFTQNNNDCFVRIKDPNGNIVFGPIALPSSGNGRIDSYAEAVAGPKKIDPVNGYDFLSFNPTMNGDYYIELNQGSATVASTTNRRYQFFDITVVDTVDNEVRNGRVWSRLWALTTTTFSNPFAAKMFARRDDSSMYRINYNSIRPFGFGIVANSYGLDSSLNFQLDRRSQDYESYYPEHQLFLSFPDTNEFPFAKDPPRFEPVSGNELSGCITTGYCFNINSNKQGQVIVILDVDGTPGFQQGGRDVAIAQVIDAGTSCVEWDGFDGQGDTLRSGNIRLEFQYEGGLVHSPIFDAENHDDGYVTERLNRATPPDTLENFWDDSEVSGTTGLNGCAPPCRTWGSDFGNEKTMNTWTVGYRDTVSFDNFSYEECPIAVVQDIDTLDFDVNNQPYNIFDNDFVLNGVLDTANAVILTNPVNGTATYNSITGLVSYSPNAGFSGLDSLEYKVCNTQPVIVCDSVFSTIVVGCPSGLTANYGLDYVDDNESDAGVPNETRILGAPDNLGVQLFDNNDEIIVYFSRTIEAGEKYNITWRKQRVVDTAKIVLAESIDNVSYTTHPNPPKINTISYFGQTVTANASFRYLRIRKENAVSTTGFEIDAISYNFFDCAIDTDEDGIADRNDIDSDNDGIPNDEENIGGFLPYGDEDRDGVFNFEDSDFTNCGTFSNGVCQNFDNDGDGVANHLDLDSDNDGIPDIVEAGGEDTDGDGKVDDISGTTLINDSDGDGLDDRYDNTEGGNAIQNSDTDNDGIPDFLDLDADNDGIPDVVEAGGTDVNGDGRADNYIDTDGDGFNDDVDGDVGNDGTSENSNDALVRTGEDSNNNGQPNTLPEDDNDGDGILNFRDLDADNDGIPDVVEAGGTDQNGDGIADDWIDADGDGFNDIVDGDPTNALAVGTDTDGTNSDNALIATGADGNGDGEPDTKPEGDFDGDNVYNFLDLDSDDDGILDVTEAGGTDTNRDGQQDGSTDNDNDGFNDSVDGDTDNSLVAGNDGNGGQQNNALTRTDQDANLDGIPDDYPNDDFDNDGNLNFLDIDADNDGITDNTEGQSTSGYIAPANNDADGDGIDDAYDSNDGSFGGANSSFELNDADADANPDTPDYLDLDADNDGTNDIVEGHDTDNDGTGDAGSVANTGESGGLADADGDGLLDGFDNNTSSVDPTNSGLEPISFTNMDTPETVELDWREIDDQDGDGVADIDDIDDDNDGILDVDESSCNNPTTTFIGNPEAFWTLDNNTNDFSGNGNNERSDGNAPGFSTNAIEGTHSADFNGTNHEIRYSQDGGFMESAYTDISFSAWIQPTNLSGNRIVYEEGGGTHGSILWLNGGALTYSIRVASNQEDVIHQTSLTVDGEWHHVAATYDNGTMRLFLDGIEANTTNTNGTAIPAHSSDGGIGGDFGGNSSGTVGGNFAGLIDAARYSNTNSWSAGRIRAEAIQFCDADGDGIPNSLDLDSDNDGIPDIIEAGGVDSDDDGRVDGVFADNDNDGWSDVFDPDATIPGTPLEDGDQDGDGLENRIDLDADDDGIADIIEAGGVDSDNDGRVDNSTDTDNDGWANTFDSDNGGSALPVADNDGDDIENYLDLDSDSDGITDNVEGQTTVAFLAPLGTDTDNDGWDDRYDSDNGGTAITLSNNEGAGEPDYLDDDSDGDGLLDWIEGFDDDKDGDALNDLVLRANNYESTNSDPLEYVTSDDADNDGIPDFLENSVNGIPSFLDPTTTFYEDNDGDGIINLYDDDDVGVTGVASATPDTDGDGENDFRDIDNQVSLPVELLSFKAVKFGSDVRLAWTTATETNNDYFIIERSTDGKNFKKILEKSGSGTSLERLDYADIDPNPESGTNYYRLTQVDFDGKSERFDDMIRVVEFGNILFEEINIYPNPSNGAELYLEINRPQVGDYLIEIISSRGKLLHQRSISIESETIQLELELLKRRQLAKGVYYLRLQNEDNVKSFKFIVQ